MYCSTVKQMHKQFILDGFIFSSAMVRTMLHENHHPLLFLLLFFLKDKDLTVIVATFQCFNITLYLY